MITPEETNIQITRINEELISDVERLLKILDHNRTTVETRMEINETIRHYMRELRGFRVKIDSL